MAFRTGRLSALLIAGLLAFPCVQAGQDLRASSDEEFGPVVRAYLGYLRNEQEVVDDRASRHEVSSTYYRRNSNRIRALRQMAIRLARESHNDYLPELEAVAGNELRQLFGSEPPALTTLKVGEVLRNTFRYLGVVRSGEAFYVFARLDPYEQAEHTDKTVSTSAAGVQVAPRNATNAPSATQNATPNATRSRRVVP
jgi:hypothetical protein